MEIVQMDECCQIENKLYNITAQVYNNLDKYKQTLLINEIINAESSSLALGIFKKTYEDKSYQIIKIYSIEEINI